MKTLLGLTIGLAMIAGSAGAGVPNPLGSPRQVREEIAFLAGCTIRNAPQFRARGFKSREAITALTQAECVGSGGAAGEREAMAIVAAYVARWFADNGVTSR